MKDLFTVAGLSKIRQRFTGSIPGHDTGQGKGRFLGRNSGKNSGILALTNPKSGTRVLTEVGCVPRLATGVSIDLATGIGVDSATGVGVDFSIDLELKTGAFTCVGSGSGTDVRHWCAVDYGHKHATGHWSAARSGNRLEVWHQDRLGHGLKHGN